MNDDLKTIYRLAEKNCGLKKDNIVRVKRKAEDCELGWENHWSETMDSLVGKIGIVEEPSSNGAGVRVWFEETNFTYFFPFYVLEKVEKKDEYEFKEYEQVLCLKEESNVWIPEIYSMKYDKYHRTVGSMYYSVCIPYKGNEHLAGKKKDV